MRNLFEVGEEVILVSQRNPDRNGQCAVLDVHDWGHCPANCGSSFAYTLTIQCYTLNNHWCECALRKKHKPGGSFESVVDMLKIPNKQPVMVDAQQEH